MRKTKLVFLAIIFFGAIFISACDENTTEPDVEHDEQLEEESEVDPVPENNNDSSDSEENTDEASDSEETDEEPNNLENEPEILLENEAFRVFEPAPDSEVGNEFVVRGQARTFEGNVQYEFEDGHNILAEGFTTASAGAPEWGDFEITIRFEGVANESGTVILFEQSAKDGSRIHELMIPVYYSE